MSRAALYGPGTPSLSWQAASLAVSSAITHAEQLGIKIDAAVVDHSGKTLAFLHMGGAFLHSEGLAIDKAYTAASFGFATRQWMTLIGDNPRLQAGIPARPRLVVLGGGLPILLDGTCIGGIGVSGGSEDQDEACARAALAALGLLTSASSPE